LESTTSQSSVLSTQSWFLHFGAVDYQATVWLNGQLLGELGYQMAGALD
jgi:hypothetical protein